jgi:hypothetical protein
MTLQASVGYKPLKYRVKVYARTQEKEALKSFSEVQAKSNVKVYGIGAVGGTEIIQYLTSSTVELESIYNELFLRYIPQSSKEKNKPAQESLSALKPEIIGLGLGGIISFGVGIFALATHDSGLATVMAGPFLASILGSILLIIGFRGNKK